MGIRTEESSVLPSLRQNDNYVECPLCLERFEYDSASDIEKKHLQTTQNLKKHDPLKRCFHP